ncbi:hypothetical protein ABIC76_004149 [Ralstonia sp. 1138]
MIEEQTMLYPSLFASFEKARWSLLDSIPWNKIDRSLLDDRDIHAIRMNAILEWSAMQTISVFLRDSVEDTDFCAFGSIWYYEEMKHCLVLMEYLRRIDESLVPSRETLRQVNFDTDPASPLETLAMHFCGEIRLNQWYRCAQQRYREPVIRTIYGLLAADEARHARAYLQYMRQALMTKGDEARAAFSKIGVLMCSPRLNRGMHPTNLHVNKSLFPNDTVNSRLPDPEWLERWLSDEICFDDEWERRVIKGILGNYSDLFGVPIGDLAALRRIRKGLSAAVTLI